MAISASEVSVSPASSMAAGRGARDSVVRTWPLPEAVRVLSTIALFPTLTGLAVGLAPKRAGATPRRGSWRLAPRVLESAQVMLLVPPLHPAGAIRATTGRTQRTVLPAKAGRTLSARRVRRQIPARSAMAARPLAGLLLDSARGPRPLRQGVRGDRREPRHRARHSPPTLWRGRLGVARRALRAGAGACGGDLLRGRCQRGRAGM